VCRGRFGHVDPRWSNKAVAVNLDGRASLLGEAELKDMRRWANQAAEQDDPNWSLSPKIYLLERALLHEERVPVEVSRRDPSNHYGNASLSDRQAS